MNPPDTQELVKQFRQALHVTDDTLEVKVREGGDPGQVVFHPLAGWENGVGLAGCFSFLVLLSLLYNLVFSESGAPPQVLYPVLAIFLASLVLRFNLEEYYVFDFQDKQVTFYRTFLGLKSKRTYARFSDFHSVGVDGRLRKGRHWFYSVKLALNNGRELCLRMSDRNDFESARDMAQASASMLNIPVAPESQPKKYLNYQRSPDGRILSVTAETREERLSG